MTGHPVRPIPDSICQGLSVLFIGYNPSLRSGEIGHNYAGRGNRFWKLLRDAGLTERLYDATEDRDLLKRGIGFTNIVARPTRRADEITAIEYEEGRKRLAELLRTYRPSVACFVGKGVYEQYSKRKKIAWGLQPKPVIAGVQEFVAPSSSGLVRMPYEEVLAIYRQLPALLPEGAGDCQTESHGR